MSDDIQPTDRAGVVLYQCLVSIIQDQIKIATVSYNNAAVQFANDQKPESRAEFLGWKQYIKGMEFAKAAITDCAYAFPLPRYFGTFGSCRACNIFWRSRGCIRGSAPNKEELNDDSNEPTGR